ncbi:hypothetical protein GA707_13785 [Nostocoides sp. F2B08]|uniref:hypothetical protein n=1 Tax=Nostocoides sp. F2B08 TaxID=2653936 RepID=UPI00126384D2|nr:hypothetical protein [Tetrasphaera sp. F2B08]KAB7743664.1 hypothetical protein GA707_13785 [Tetrasphaera sp. F2B08]
MEIPRRRLPRDVRSRRAAGIAARYGGVAHRADLRKVGVGRDDVRGEVEAGRWRRLGRHTVGVTTGDVTGPAQWWHAIWESGAGAILDGVSALLASGMTGFSADAIDVAIPKRNRRHRVAGVRLRHYSVMPPSTRGGIPRVVPERALLNAMQWAMTDRTAALLLCLAVQQRIVSPQRLTSAFMTLTRCRRRAFIKAVIRDVCDGAHSLGELDVASLCRRYGLPPPTRQAVRRTPGGRVYLDLAWEDVGLVVEIDGGHHATALSPVLDALRQCQRTAGFPCVRTGDFPVGGQVFSLSGVRSGASLLVLRWRR